MSRSTVRWLKVWLEYAGVEEGAIFRRLIGRDQIGGPLNPGSIAAIFKRVARWIGMPARYIAGVSGQSEKFWSYKRWTVKALAAEGNADEAIQFAESNRGPWTNDADVNLLCEGILLSLGRTPEAYRRYGLYAHRAGTYLATFRAVAKAYPSVPRAQILLDLIETTPGEEGKWFATAKELGLYEVALKLVRESPCDPKTLARAARDFAEREPAFAHGAGLAALYWLIQGHGYEITSIDVWGAYHSTLKAAENLGNLSDTKTRIRQLVAQEAGGGFVRQILGRELALP